jgi:hypothetical protein
MAKKIETKTAPTPVEIVKIYDGSDWVNPDASAFDFENNTFDGSSWIPKTTDEVNG